MIEQGSEAWFQVRLGKATASRISDVISRTKTGWGASRQNYAAELIAERLTGKPAERYENAAMVWGRETEPLARAAYAFRHDVDVGLAEFTDHPAIAMSGASPDGLIGTDGLVEIKAPNTATHIDTLLGAGAIPDKYIVQMLWQLACTEREYCDFVSFDPRLPEPMRLYVKRVFRDDKRISELEAQVADFLNEVGFAVATLRKRYEAAEMDQAFKDTVG